MIAIMNSWKNDMGKCNPRSSNRSFLGNGQRVSKVKKHISCSRATPNLHRGNYKVPPPFPVSRSPDVVDRNFVDILISPNQAERSKHSEMKLPLILLSLLWRAFLCTLYAETPERAFYGPSRNQTGFLEARSGVCVSYKKSASVHPVHANPRTGLLQSCLRWGRSNLVTPRSRRKFVY